jgi:hypothetical protein
MTIGDPTDTDSVAIDSAGATSLVGATVQIGDAATTGVNVLSSADTLTVTATGTDTATFIGADAASPANTALDTTGGGSITIGSADVTEVILNADTDVQIHNGATGNVTLSLHDYADTATDDLQHVLFTGNCTGTDATEDCDLTVGVVTAASMATQLTIDGDYGDDGSGAAVIVGSATAEVVQSSTDGSLHTVDSTPGYVTQTSVGDTAVGIEFRDYGSTDDEDMVHAVITSDCTTTTTGAEDCDLTIGVAEAGAAPETRLNIDADGGITLGSANAGTILLDGSQITLDADGVDFCVDCSGVTPGGSVAVTDSGTPYFGLMSTSAADDDMLHFSIQTALTTTTSGAEDSDATFRTVTDGDDTVRMQIDGDGDIELWQGDIDLNEPLNGGNGDIQNTYIGIPLIAPFSLGSDIANGTTNTTNVDFGDSETPATDWIAVDGDVTVANETTIFRKGTASLEIAVAASSVEENDGAVNALGTGDQDWSGDEGFGLWMNCTAATTAGDWKLSINDNASYSDVNIPAIAWANVWNWLEVDHTAVADADKDVVTDLAIRLSVAGASAMVGETCYFDYLWKWDVADEEALGYDVIEDGVFAVYSVVDAAANIVPIVEVEGTDYFIHYESGNDFLVPISDLSNDALWGMLAVDQ